MIDYIPLSYHDAIIRSLIVILPSEGTSLVHTYGWDFFSKKIKFYDPSNPETSEFLKSLAYLMIIDAIAKSLESLDAKNIKRDTIYALLTNGFLYIRNIVGKRNIYDYDQLLYQETIIRWTVIFGELAKFE